MLTLRQNSLPELTSQEIKKLPFFMPNCDPFGMKKVWEELLQNDDFKQILNTIVNTNKNAISQGFFYGENGEKILSPYDICLQAFFLSYSESLSAQKNVIENEEIGSIDVRDLTNFSDLFRGYGDKYKRSFKKSMDFSIKWFQKLIQDYDNNGFHGAKDNFTDIERNFTYENEKKYFDFHHNDKPARIELDFKAGKSKLFINDFFVHNGSGKRMLSEEFEEANPFENLEKLNFLFPMGYRGFTFPLLNVTEIEIKKLDGTTKIYSRQQAQGAKRIGVTAQQIGGYIQKFLNPEN